MLHVVYVVVAKATQVLRLNIVAGSFLSVDLVAVVVVVCNNYAALSISLFGSLWW